MYKILYGAAGTGKAPSPTYLKLAPSSTAIVAGADFSRRRPGKAAGLVSSNL
jgi:hypothetical protein